MSLIKRLIQIFNIPSKIENEYILLSWNTFKFNFKLFLLSLFTTFTILSLLFFENFLDNQIQIFWVSFRFSIFIFITGYISRFFWLNSSKLITIHNQWNKQIRVISTLFIVLIFLTWHSFSLYKDYKDFSTFYKNKKITLRWGMKKQQLNSQLNLNKCKTQVNKTLYQKNIIKQLYYKDEFIICSYEEENLKNTNNFQIFFFRDNLLTGYFILHNYHNNLDINQFIQKKLKNEIIYKNKNPKNFFNQFYRDTYFFTNKIYIQRKRYYIEYYIDKYSIERKSIRRIQKIFSDILFMNKYKKYPNKYFIDISFYNKFKQTQFIYQDQVKIFQIHKINQMLQKLNLY